MKFYLYRDNYVVRIGEGDRQLETKLQSQGYELYERPLSSREDAEIQQNAWQRDIDTRRAQGLF